MPFALTNLLIYGREIRARESKLNSKYNPNHNSKSNPSKKTK
jgi:hypothetical protein